MTFFWIAVIIAVLWWIVKSNRSKISNGDKPLDVAISEEKVFEAQNTFEKKLKANDLPDSISYKDLYVYWKLMNPWYQKLAGENRYKGEMIQKLRRDWLEYMTALQDRSTYNYLSLESEGEDSENYRQEHIVASRKAFAIEDAFAAAVGKESVEELGLIRKKSDLDFSSSGELTS